jgi:MFS family permease
MIVGNLLAGTTTIFQDKFHFTQFYSYRIMFWVTIIMVLLSLFPLLLIREGPREAKKRIGFRISSWNVIGKFSLVNGLIGLGAGFFIPLLPLYLNLKFSASEASIGSLLAVSNAVTGIAYLVGPLLVRKFGSVGTVVLTEGSSVIPLLLMPLSPNFTIAAVLYATRATLMNMSSPIFTTYLMESFSDEERASASSITQIAWNGMNGISTIASGRIMTASIDTPVYICGVLYSLSALMFYVFFKKRHPNKKGGTISET